MRQLWDFQRGTRKGAWSPLMKPIVANLTQDDMLNISAYVAAQGR
jgi:cytochrome c553